MKVTIITVCFNSEKTIEKTFISVKNQSYKDIEYIVVDGNSSDSTINIIEKYKNIIQTYISEKDNGLYDAMNKGINISTGQLIGILNSDDVFYDDNVIENIVRFHKKYKIHASIGDIVQTNLEGKIKRIYSSKNWNPYKLKIGFMPPHPSIFFEKHLFNKLGNYKLNFKSGSDFDLIVRFFLINKITWKYSGIKTTKMLIGGISSSGFKSYNLITNEICSALSLNKIKYKKLKIYFRFLWKIFELKLNYYFK